MKNLGQEGGGGEGGSSVHDWFFWQILHFEYIYPLQAWKHRWYVPYLLESKIGSFFIPIQEGGEGGSLVFDLSISRGAVAVALIPILSLGLEWEF